MDYISLRSKLGINSYPYSDVTTFKTSENDVETLSSVPSNSERISPLACSMEVYKFNTLYHFNVDFGKGDTVKLQDLKLYFDADNLSSYKILVRVLAPTLTKRDGVIFQRLYDEDYYSLVCDKSQNTEMKTYFQSGNVDESNSQEAGKLAPQ